MVYINAYIWAFDEKLVWDKYGLGRIIEKNSKDWVFSDHMRVWLIPLECETPSNKSAAPIQRFMLAEWYLFEIGPCFIDYIIFDGVSRLEILSKHYFF